LKSPILVLGARSDIGLAVAHRFAADGHPVQLAARNVTSLEPARVDLELRYAVSVSLHEFDVLDRAAFEGFVDGLPELPGIAISVVGLLGDQSQSQDDLDAASVVMRSNFEGPALVLADLANRFEARGSGILIGVSSVAGDRGRSTNYVYGSAKAGFTAFLSGLRNRLARKGVHVVTVLPGFVATKMTEGMDLPKRITAQPEDVAEAIWRAASRKRNVIYVPWIWAVIMMIIRNLPEALFKRLKI
jgi:short-subunit dehydrogenase